MQATKDARTPVELHKLTYDLQNALNWLTHAHTLSGDEDGRFIEEAQAVVEKALESLRKQHNVS
jgi:hypothetical protein